MEVFDAPGPMRAWSRRERGAGGSIGVVPTMGALHAGHRSLIELAHERATRVVVTIFVNPLQFNEDTDFDAYPRPIDDDLTICAATGVDAVFAPTAAAMYTPGFETRVVPGPLADRLEGPMRPGHFEGVTTVVAKLFGATDPDLAVFGEKDYQQLAIVRRMVTDLDMGIEIVGAPIVRESDRLALSSRNVRLTPDDRAVAPVLAEALRVSVAACAAGERRAATLRSLATQCIEAEPRARLEYVEIVDTETLVPVETVGSAARILTAAWFGDVRLIDNCAIG